MTVRPARPSDVPALTELTGELGYPSPQDSVRMRLEFLQTQDDHAVFVAEAAQDEKRAEDGLDGWIHVFGAHTLESDPFAEIGGLVVRADRRGRGIGKALIGAGLDWAARRGYARIRVRSQTKRLEAHAFYEHLGFERLKTQAVFTGRSERRPPGPRR